jgi:hypothetical protein
MTTPFDGQPGLLLSPGYLGPDAPSFIPESDVIQLRANQSLNIGYQQSTIQGTISFARNPQNTLFENLGMFAVNTVSSLVETDLGVLNNLVQWDTFNLGTLRVCGNVQAGSEVPAILTNNGSGCLVMPQAMRPSSIVDSLSNAGTSGQLLSAGNGGQLLWSAPPGGSVVRANVAQFNGETGSANVTFSAPLPGQGVVVTLSYVGLGQGTPLVVVSSSNEGFLATGAPSASFSYIATSIG